MYERLTDKRIAHGGFIEYKNYDKFAKLPNVREIYDRLCELEDKIEQGKIVELPCKIGDEVWINRYFHSKLLPQKGVVSEMKFLPNMELQIVVKYVGRGRWGKDIFATLEEANKSKLH